MLDKENVDLRYTEQLADSEQTMALAYFYALSSGKGKVSTDSPGICQ